MSITNCSLCYGLETHLLKGKRKVCKPDKDVTAFVCSTCVQKILGMLQERLKEVVRLFIDKDRLEKAEIIQSFIEEEEREPKAGETRPDMVRERPLRQVRPSYR